MRARATRARACWCGSICSCTAAIVAQVSMGMNTSSRKHFISGGDSRQQHPDFLEMAHQN
jgi:hypothetical protein